MKKIILHSGLLLAAISLIVVSCVQQEYDIEELNTEMTIGAAGLGIPLGSTQQLKIQDFLDSNDVRANDHTAFHAGVFDQFCLFHHVGVPLGKIVLHRGNGIYHFFVVCRHNVEPSFI